MKEFIEKLIGRLEEQKSDLTDWAEDKAFEMGIETAIQIVNQLAEEVGVSEMESANIQTIDVAELIEKFGQKKVCNDGWIACEKELPPHSDDLLLIQCNGKPRNNIHLVNAFCLASYTEDGWILEMYPDWKDAEVVAWKNLGEPYQPKGE